MQDNPEDGPPEIYVTWSDPRMTDFENTDRTMHLPNQLLLIYSNAYAAFFNWWIGKEYRFNPIIYLNAFAWDRNVAWWTISLLFLKPFAKSETDRSPRNIALKFLLQV